MNEKNYLHLIKKIKKVLGKMEKIRGYNLSGAGWKDNFSSWERERLYEKNEKIQSKKDKYRELVSEMLYLLIQSGYSTDEILDNFEPSEQKELLPLLKALDDYSSTHDLNNVRK